MPLIVLEGIDGAGFERCVNAVVTEAGVDILANHQTGKSTDLVYSDYEFGVGLDDDDFERGVLTRLR